MQRGLIVMAMAGAASTSLAQPRGFALDVITPSRIWIEGRSNVGAWSCRAATFDSRVDASATSPDATRGHSVWLGDLIRRVDLRVSVRDFRCGNTEMERDLQRALGGAGPDSSARNHIFASFTPMRANRVAPGAVFESEGIVLVAGTTRTARVTMAVDQGRDGTVRVSGSAPLRMTDFGVQPPRRLLGLIRSHDDIVVRFDLTIGEVP